MKFRIHIAVILPTVYGPEMWYLTSSKEQIQSVEKKSVRKIL
jgi:hypothetical protein